MSKELTAFKHALLTHKVASRFVAADDRIAKEFPTEEALKKYLQEHPKADKSKHKVVDEETSKLKKDLKNFAKGEKARGKAKERKDKKQDDDHAKKLKKELEAWKNGPKE